mmetsp:Transcript_17447/g.38135  ORF Transcript_17447/g.38135 Transcript_17447/m.38135 type:complete len:289 (-) Transcript_17447:509-1375(-)
MRSTTNTVRGGDRPDDGRDLQSTVMMGCDRGGADNQRMTFFGTNFGTCSTMDRCLCAAMPTQLAYYCPTYCRPYCGGRCYSLTEREDCLDGIVRDAGGGRWNFLEDPRFWNVEVETWGYGTALPIWPSNFGQPSCAYDYSAVFEKSGGSSNTNNNGIAVPPTRAPTSSNNNNNRPTWGDISVPIDDEDDKNYEYHYEDEGMTETTGSGSGSGSDTDGSLFDTVKDSTSTLVDTLKDAKDSVLDTASTAPGEWSSGQIAGVSVGVFVGIVILYCLAWWAGRRSGRKTQK